MATGSKIKQPAPPDRKFAEVVLPARPQKLSLAAPVVPDLGPLKNLVGLWTADGTGWNMIAVPFQGAPAGTAKFRILMNQYSEQLKFDFVDDSVKNRGLARPGDPDFDQVVAALDYQQQIAQVKAEDFPVSSNPSLAGPPQLAIHHEPGLWLYEKNRRAKDDQIDKTGVSEVELKVARLASIPHGNSVCAIGTAEELAGLPDIPPVSGLPSGRFEDVSTPAYDFKSDPYLAPYKHYIDHPFMGTVTGVPGFPGFHPADMNAILRFANQGLRVAKTTVLTVDTTRKSGGVSSLPFSVREADPVSMKSTFWIQELIDKDANGQTQFRLQYSQIVMLRFFRPREDEQPGLVEWPHISIATLTKVPAPYPLVAA